MLTRDDAIALGAMFGCSLAFWLFVVHVVSTVKPLPLGLSHETLVIVRANKGVQTR